MKKGYTLVELLAVIVILAIVLGLVTMSAISYFNRRKVVDYENTKKIIVSNAKVLVESTSKEISKTVDKNLTTSNVCRLNYSDLVAYNLVDKDTKNPTTGQVISGTYVKVILNTTTYEYSYEYVDNANENIIDCLSGM